MPGCVLAAAIVASSRVTASPDWRVEGGRASAALVDRDADLPPGMSLSSPMLRRLAGGIDFLDGGRLGQLKRTLRGRLVKVDESPKPVAYIHALGDPGARAASDPTYTLARLADGGLVVGEGDPAELAGLAWSQVDEDRLLASGFGWVTGSHLVPTTGLKQGEPTDLAAPYACSQVTLTRSEAASRLPGKLGLRLGELSRELSSETFRIRLPEGFEADNASGLLVWISPTPDGTPPRSLWEGADELGMILIGADNSGNQRSPVDRFQLALDAVAIASSRFTIDESRVYAVGMSGGGRMASVMWCNAPDVFTGAVGIVGMFSPHSLRIEGNRIALTNDWPRSELRKQIGTHRLAGMGGPPDFNYTEMKQRTRLLGSDGYDVRFFEYEDMGHVMPEPTRFVEALRWVDEPARNERVSSEAEARELLDGVLKKLEPVATPDAESAATLVMITEIAPWTAPAWDAARLLGYTGQGDASDPE